MKPLVSIICPVRNEQTYIKKCLQSLVDQTFERDKIEILVVDGMSEDGTREIVRQFCDHYPHIRMIDNPEKIVPYALNAGIRQAAGEYILRMDGHACAAPDYVEKCVAALSTSDAECVGGPIISVNETGTGKAIAAAMSSPFGVGNAAFRTSTNKRMYVDSLAFPGFKRKVFTKYGLFDEELVKCQDDEFNFRIRHMGGRILLTPEVRSWYFPHTNFRKLWKQYFGYGFWKIRVLQKHFWKMQPRHFVPAVLVGSLLFFLSGSLFLSKMIWLFVSLALVYVLASIAAATLTSLKKGIRLFPKILLSFYILHYSYGLGFLLGLIKFAPRWTDKRVAHE